MKYKLCFVSTSIPSVTKKEIIKFILLNKMEQAFEINNLCYIIS